MGVGLNRVEIWKQAELGVVTHLATQSPRMEDGKFNASLGNLMSQRGGGLGIYI